MFIDNSYRYVVPSILCIFFQIFHFWYFNIEVFLSKKILLQSTYCYSFIWVDHRYINRNLFLLLQLVTFFNEKQKKKQDTDLYDREKSKQVTPEPKHFSPKICAYSP